MKKYLIIYIFLNWILSPFLSEKVGAQIPKKNIIANPLNLNYRFQFDEPSRREAADPVCEYFKGKYYLFASKSGGSWSSPDLKEWTYIPYTSIATIENYAPTILACDDTLYYLIGGSPRIFYTTNPDIDDWKELNTKFSYGTADPAFFKDEETGKVYIYWGCSDIDPIMGVEVNPGDGFRAVGSPRILIEHNGDKYGWEVPGKNNNENRQGWNEGACMIKYKGKYYLQYAAPGTENRNYADGIYVGDNPLGPFTYQDYNPFSIKPGGFIGSAGHGHTFKDKYGNYWHIASMRISVRHAFERRLGLFPAYFTADDKLFSHTAWTDYPFAVPDEKTDFQTNNLSMNWNLLSYNKPASASSTITGRRTGYANDEQVETWWAARTGNAGEWWQVDLKTPVTVHAIQVNFADEGFTVKANPSSYVYYQYLIEMSDDGQNWIQLVDKRQNTADAPHDLIVPDEPVKTRYLKITNAKTMNGKFSLSDFRVFGFGAENNNPPQEVTGISVIRNENDKRRFQLNWDNRDNATGYIVRWGVNKNQLNNAVTVYANRLEAGYFNRDSEYWFSIDAFNENGLTSGKTVVSGNPTGMGTPGKAGLTVFPNPSDGIFNIQLPEAGKLSLSNISGQALFSAYYPRKNAIIDASDYMKGIYILSYISGNMNDNIKLIKK
jgi:hypothetical protein